MYVYVVDVNDEKKIKFNRIRSTVRQPNNTVQTVCALSTQHSLYKKLNEFD